MSRYLVVANQTTTSPRLVEELRAVARRRPGVEFVLEVPATPSGTCCSGGPPTCGPTSSPAGTPSEVARASPQQV